MSILERQIAETLAPGMSIPEPLCRLFAWIEDRGLFIERDGQRLGFLFPQDRLKAGWTDTERPGGTDIAFAAEVA